MKLSRQASFSIAYGVILSVTTLLGVELMASFFTPPWPARALRSIEPVNVQVSSMPLLADKPSVFEPYNSWGMRDRERSLAKPPNIGKRAIIVGDSFVESSLTRRSLPQTVEQRFALEGRTNIEVVSLGVSGTGPRSYYYRVRNLALSASPDAIVVVFYAGNDFVSQGDGYSAWMPPPLISESPGGSLLGLIMPRTNWLLVNRMGLSESQRGNKPIPNELESINLAVRLPAEERLKFLVHHVKTHYHPDVSEERLTEIIGRAGEAVWREFESREIDQEYLFGWLLNLLVDWETADNRDYARTPSDAVRLVGSREVDATLSWLTAIDSAARANGVPLIVFLAPVGTVDPDFVAFWKPWPRYFSWNYLCNERHTRLVAALRGTGVRFVDLREDLDGLRGTYRKIDAHWTEKSVNIVAQRIERELNTLFGDSR